MALPQGPAALAVPHPQLSMSSSWCHTTSWSGDSISARECSLSSAIFFARSQGSSARHVLPGPLFGQKTRIEKVWREFLSDPSQWWDHRSEKANPRYPDFKHKKTQQALWLVDNLTPAWVESELAALPPGVLQSHIFSWHVRLRQHLKAGDYKKTLNLFQQMQGEGVVLDKFTFISVLNACSNLRSLEEGRLVHEQILLRGCQSDVFVATSLVNMYAKCGSIRDAWSVFNSMRKRDVVSWTAMIGGYVKTGQSMKAMKLFRKMQQEGVEPNAVTFMEILNACASVAALEEGRRVHAQIIQRGCESDISVANCLIDMYAKSGSIEEAWGVFNKMREPNVVSWSAMIGGYVKSGRGLKAMELFEKMQRERVEPNAVTFVVVLNACASVMALAEGRRVHEQIIQKRFESDVYVANCLVDMYAKCGSIEDAWSVFNKMRDRDVVSWSAMIGGYVKSEQGLRALQLFQKMEQEGVEPNAKLFVGVLNACASVGALEEGRRVHEQIIQRGWESDVYVATCLVDMYAKCGSIDNAWSVFNKMHERNVVSWSAMIGGYVKVEQGLKAIELFQKMQQERVEPEAVTFVGVLNACASLGALEEGRLVHQQILQRGCESDIYVANCLVDMYAKCGSIEDACIVFNRMRKHDLVSWNAMIGGYVKSEQELKAMELFQKMQQEGVEPNAITFVGVLSACASVLALEKGRHVHEQIIQGGCESDLYVATCLVDMYAKCGSIEDAWDVFNKMQEHDVVSWSAIIGGYVKSEQGLKALELFWKMQQKVEPNIVTFVGVLNACASIAALEEGRRVHELIIRREYESDVYVANCLVDMYAKCGSIEDAWNVFNKMRECNVVSWSAMIGGYVKAGQGLKAIELFRKMQQEQIEPDPVTFVGVLSACATVGSLEEGMCVHELISESGCESDVYVANCLIDMYAKCGSIEDAWSVFKKMPKRDTVSWSTMIAGFVKCKQGLKAIEIFQKMRREEVEPDTVTFVAVLNACTSVAALEEGRHVHEQIIQQSWESNVYVATCLVDMYAKCGSIGDAWSVFNKMGKRDAISWNSMIGGYAMHGHPKEAIGLFRRMGKEAVDIDEITFTCLLSACSHGGMVKEGLRYFNYITSSYNVVPTMEHFTCVVDLLGRSGRLEEAEEITMGMPMKADAAIWMCLIGACRIHGNIEIAERAAKQYKVLNTENASGHVLLSNMGLV